MEKFGGVVHFGAEEEVLEGGGEVIGFEAGADYDFVAM